MVSKMTLQSVIKNKHAIGFIIPAGPNWRAFDEAGLPIGLFASAAAAAS